MKKEFCIPTHFIKVAISGCFWMIMKLLDSNWPANIYFGWIELPGPRKINGLMSRGPNLKLYKPRSRVRSSFFGVRAINNNNLSYTVINAHLFLSSQQLAKLQKKRKFCGTRFRLWHALKLLWTAMMHLISPVISCTDNCLRMYPLLNLWSHPCISCTGKGGLKFKPVKPDRYKNNTE